MKLSTRILVVLLIPAIAPAEESLPFQRTDVFELEWVSDPRISPDGKQVVYVRNSMDVMQDSRTGRLWLANVDGSEHVPLTGRDVGESDPVWSPDGTRIAFTSATDNGTELFVYWLSESRIARLTQLDRSPRNLRWSPDGHHIAFSKLVPEAPVVLVTAPTKPEGAEWAEAPRVTTRLKYERDGSGYIEPGYYQYFIVPAIGGSPRQVSSGQFNHSGAPEWTTDGKRLIFSGNRNENWELETRNSEIYSIEVETGQTEALTDRQGPDFGPVISPDGRQIAYLGFDDKVQTYQVTRLHVMDVDGGNKRELLSELDRSVSSLTWNRDGIWFTL